MIRNLTSSQLKIFYIYIFYFSLYSYIILGITTSSSFLSPIIINNSHSFIISMLFRNLTLIFFFLLIRQFDVCEIHSRSFYQTYHPKYYRYVFLFFVFLFFFPAMVDKYISHASIHEFKLPFNILNVLLFVRCD